MASEVAREALELVRWPQLDARTLASLRRACAADDAEPSSATSVLRLLPEGSAAAPYNPTMAGCSGVVCALLPRGDGEWAEGLAGAKEEEEEEEEEEEQREEEGLMGRWTRQRKWGFDVEGAALYATLTGHTSIVVTLASSRCGWLISGSQDGTVRAWDPATSTLNHTLHGLSPFLSALVEVQRSPTDAAAPTPTGPLLAVGSADGSIALCDVLAGRVVSTLQAGGDVRALVVVPVRGEGGAAEEVLVSGGPRAPLRVWEMRRSTLLRELPYAPKRSFCCPQNAASCFEVLTTNHDHVLALTRTNSQSHPQPQPTPTNSQSQPQPQPTPPNS